MSLAGLAISYSYHSGAQVFSHTDFEAHPNEIIDALKMACAWEFVEKLPDRIDHPIGERGKGFSEGQAQRLAIANMHRDDTPHLCA